MLTTLRGKVLISVVAAFLVATTLLFLASSRIVLGGFAQLEQDSVLTDIKRAEDALDGSLVTLQTLCGDWSGWDETRDFILGKNDKYIENNLNDDSLVNIHVSFMAFLDLTGRVVRIKSIDLEEGKEVPNLPSLAQVTSHPALLQHKGPRDLKSGIVMLPEGALLVAAGPVTNSTFEPPVNGTFITGRFLDEAEVEALGARTHLKVSFFHLDQADLPPDVQQARASLSADAPRTADTPRIIEEQGPDLVSGYSVVRDVDGKPALILRVEEPRAILRQGLQTARLFTGILFLVGLVTFSILAIVLHWAVLRPLAKLHAHVAHLRDSKDLSAHVDIRSRDELGALATAFNDTTDSLRQAQADLDAMHQKLMEMARHAGMADVASGILHNVGNVLNSVNVATANIKSQVRDLRVDNLVRATDLVKEHIADLGRYLTEDERGSKLPEYLAGLALHLKEAQGDLTGRLLELERHVQHIAEIVALQQSVGRRIGVIEPVDLAEIVGDAIKINTAALIRHGIELNRDLAPAPRLLVDRHQVLQILVNLIGNAKYALRESDRLPKQITVRIEPPDGGRVRISVVDNGVGIAPENMERIFAYGFTTRKDGHGFGLHTAALAAKQLDGTLVVHSEGVGKGATFVLELPVEKAMGENSSA